MPCTGVLSQGVLGQLQASSSLGKGNLPEGTANAGERSAMLFKPLDPAIPDPTGPGIFSIPEPVTLPFLLKSV